VERCAPPDTDLLPCPPHSVCEAGQVVACDNHHLWVLHQPEGSTVPTSCVPSSDALAAVALATKRLEAWSWPATCEGNPDTSSTPPPESRKGGEAVDRVMFSYRHLVSSLRDDESAFVAAIEPGQFAELARGRLSVLWGDKEEEDGASGAPGLWLGLLPGHTQHLPASCRAANVIVAFARTAWGVVYSGVKVAVLTPAYDAVRFVLKVGLVIFKTYPFGLTLGSIWLVVAALYWRKKSQQRADREAFRADVDLTLGAAIDVLKREEEPLRCLALRDDLREHLEGRLQGDSHHFNRRVWPEVQSVLESDQRVALRLVRGDQSFLWVGPTASSQ
jgi:hypothetical protein